MSELVFSQIKPAPPARSHPKAQDACAAQTWHITLISPRFSATRRLQPPTTAKPSEIPHWNRTRSIGPASGVSSRVDTPVDAEILYGTAPQMMAWPCRATAFGRFVLRTSAMSRPHSSERRMMLVAGASLSSAATTSARPQSAVPIRHALAILSRR